MFLVLLKVVSQIEKINKSNLGTNQSPSEPTVQYAEVVTVGKNENGKFL